MQEVLEAIERHLGRKLPISQLDYYQVIGLELYCNDAQRIRKALQDATNRWMQSETGKYPESAQIIAKLLKQAQTILLDPEKQERYNLQLQKLRSSPTPDSTTSVEDQGSSNRNRGVETDDARQFFPNADPMIPFSFEATGAQSFSSGNGCAVLVRLQDPLARLAELEQLFPSLAEYEKQSQQEDNYDRHDPPSFLTKPETASRGLSLAQQISRRRKRNRIIASMLFFFGSQAILGLAIWAYLNNQGRLASKNKGLAKGQWQENMADAPKLPGIPSEAKNKTEVFLREPSSNEVKKDSSSASMQEQSERKPTNQSRQPTGNPDAMMPPAPMPDPAPMPTAKPEPEKPAESMESNAPTEESEEWKKRMANARKALDKADFETFEKIIVTGVETAQTPAGREQASRLDQLGQLYKIGSESFEEARSKLKASSTLKMGPSEISIVENTSEKLVIRVSGKNQTHLWEKLPAGIAIAMLDLTLDSDAATDVAARAVFFSLAPQFRETATKNDSLKKRIAGWFEKSLGKDPIRVDLPQALTDSFE